MKKILIPILVILIALGVVYAEKTKPVISTSTVPTVVNTEPIANDPQPVLPSTTTVTALSLLEDSRCPMNARCIWAGTVKVHVRVTVGTKSEEGDLTLNEPKMVAGKTITLTDVTPESYAGKTYTFKDYKFTFSVK